MNMNTKEISDYYLLPFGLDCLYNKLYWIIYRLMYELAEKSGVNPFDCCHLYQECSDATRCISPLKELRYDCTYRKNLNKGLIFFGSNRNID